MMMHDHAWICGSGCSMWTVPRSYEQILARLCTLCTHRCHQTGHMVQILPHRCVNMFKSGLNVFKSGLDQVEHVQFGGDRPGKPDSMGIQVKCGPTGFKRALGRGG